MALLTRISHVHWALLLTAVLIACAACRSAQERSSGSAQVVESEERSSADQWCDIQDAALPDVLERLASATCSQLRSQGVNEERLKLLHVEIRVLMTALALRDFDSYAIHMTAKGASLDEMADGYIEQLQTWGVYSANAPELSPARPRSQRVRYLWTNPRPRHWDWSAIEVDTVRAKIGLVARAGTSDWPYHGFYSQLSLFAPRTGRLSEIDGERIANTSSAVSAMVHVRFHDSTASFVRIVWYFDETDNTWVPFAIEVGNHLDARPLPLI